jgi:hypothetical protein
MDIFTIEKYHQRFRETFIKTTGFFGFINQMSTVIGLLAKVSVAVFILSWIITAI